MKRLHLLRLTLENFKGTASFLLEPEGGSITVCGTNGTGKTTLFDAYNWLLFGKDSAGRSDSSFDVKPYGAKQPIVTVEGVFDCGDGSQITLTRQVAEKVTRQRGTDETSIKNEYKFFVDGVPKTKTQYDQIVAELCPASSFRMVSDPDYFAGKLKWDERRSVLTRLFGEVDERQLLGQSEEWQPLIDAAGEHSMSDYRAMIVGERKKVKAELDAIPDRINEAERAIPEQIAEFDPVAFAALESNLNEAEQRLREASNGTAEAQLRQRIAEAKTRLAQRKAESIAIWDNDEARKSKSEAERELYHLKQKRSEVEQQRGFVSRQLEDARRELDRLRCEYQEINALTWDKGAENCPYCGQSLPEERIESLRREFNSDKSYRLERNVTAGMEKKEEEARHLERVSDIDAEIVSLGARIEAAQRKVNQLVDSIVTPPPFETTEMYAESMVIIDTLENELAAFNSDNAEKLRELRVKVECCRAELDEARNNAAAAALAEKQKTRIDELKASSRALGKRAAELDRLLDMSARFEQYKLSAIEESVNSRFQYARFKLFDRQLNGGYAECCEVVVDGAPYSTNLNPGKKINAGLDIVRTLSEAIGFSAPVWIDNAESYVNIFDIGAQMICLQVDSEAHQLTVNQSN